MGNILSSLLTTVASSLLTTVVSSLLTTVVSSLLTTVVSSLLTTVVSSLLTTVVSSLLTTVVSRPPLLSRRVGARPTLLQSCSPPPKGVRAAAVLTPLDGQRYQPRHVAPPATSPPPGLRAGWPCSMRPQLYLPSPGLAPHGSDPPLAGRVVGAGQPAGSPAKRPQLASQLFSVSNSPSWADVVRNGKPPSPPPPATTTATTTPATADFLALYERCVCNGLKTRINISNNAGIQEISVTCQLPAATALVRRRRRRRPRRRGLVAGPAVTLPP